MSASHSASEYRVEKRRIEATLTLTGGHTVSGCFFVSVRGQQHEGPERVDELLNADDGFFPFERSTGGRPDTVLYNRSHIVAVALREPEAQRVPGYDVATRRSVALLLSTGTRVVGSVRVYRPEGHNRLSDWARDPSAFRFVETDDATLLVNVTHIVEANEAEDTRS
jgi:hypothetical protein